MAYIDDTEYGDEYWDELNREYWVAVRRKERIGMIVFIVGMLILAYIVNMLPKHCN